MSSADPSKGFHTDSEGMSMWKEWRANTHKALSNGLILDKIFVYLEKKDLESARLVNSTWHSTLQPQWRNTVNYRLGLGKDYRVHRTGEKVTPQFLEQQHPENNVNDPFQFVRHPIRNVSLPINYVDSKWIGANLASDQTRFWELYGSGLTSITLERVRIHQAALLKRLLFELTPNLEEFSYIDSLCKDIDQLQLNSVTEYIPPGTLQKTLKFVDFTIADDNPLNLEGDDDDDFKLGFPISWIEFFSAFPNIKTLKLDFALEPENLEIDPLKVFEAIDIIRKANNNQVLNITEIQTDHAGFAPFDFINNQSLFNTLPIAILDKARIGIKYDQIISVVQTWEATLRRLYMETYRNDNDEFVSYPNSILPRGLTKLGLYGQVFSSWEFLAYTPNLEELEIACEGACEFLRPVATVSPLANLKRLEVMYDEPLLLLPATYLTYRNNILPAFSLTINCGTFKVTDKSVFEGVVNLPNIAKLCLPLHVELTEKGLAALKKKLGKGLFQSHSSS